MFFANVRFSSPVAVARKWLRRTFDFAKPISVIGNVSKTPLKVKNLIKVIVFLSALLFFGFLFKKYFYNPKHKTEIAKGEVKKTINKEIQNGDIIFQTSLSAQSKAIQLATGSKYSHCGLIFRKGSDKKNWYVLEAVQPVKWTPLTEWIARGKDGHYIIKRFKTDPMLPEGVLLELRKNAEKHLGKDYDLTFEWSDEKIYCSELIWKVYNETTGLSVGNLQKLKEFNLDNPIVKSKMTERYGKNIPLNETVISPKAIFDDADLILIDKN